MNVHKEPSRLSKGIALNVLLLLNPKSDTFGQSITTHQCKNSAIWNERLSYDTVTFVKVL